MLEAINTKTGKKRSTGWFDNLILNQGLNVMGSSAPLNYCRVGTSGVAVDVSQTTLGSQVASSNTINSNVYGWDTVGNEYGYNRRVFRFAAGVATGTLEEVGVGQAASTGLFSRALILNGGGTPTPFVVGASDILDVTYELRYYPKITDTVTVVNVNGIDYTFTIRPENADVTFGATTNIRFLGAAGSSVGMNAGGSSASASTSNITFNDYLSALSGLNITSSPPVISSYVSGSYELVRSWNFGPSAGTAPLYAFMFPTSCGQWKMQVSPPLPKSAINSLTIAMNMSWGRRT